MSVKNKCRWYKFLGSFLASSGLNLLKRWVQAFQPGARVGGCKAPVGFVVVVIATRAPCSDLADKGGSVGDAVVEALA